jgi:tetratricopeptide (TPR) repeat protein
MKGYFLKSQHLFSMKTTLCCLWSLGFIISGCALNAPHSAPAPACVSSVKYRSELTDPEAKAFFAFSEFRILGAENRWHEAISALQRAISFDPQSNYLPLVLAQVYVHQQQPKLAVETLEVLLSKDPESIAGHQLMGDALSYQQEFSAAIEHFRSALAIAPENNSLKLRLAMSLIQLGRKDEAIEVLEALLKQQPDVTLAQLYLARLYLGKKQIDKASLIYHQLLQSQPAQLQAILEYGKILEQQDQDAALELYHNYLAENPRAAAVRQQLAQYYLAKHQLGEALAQFQVVRQQYPDNLQIINHIGLIQLELEAWGDAEKTFRQLLQTDNQQGRNRYYLAMAFSGQGKREEAISVLEPIHEDSPVYPEAALQLTYLYKQNGQNDRAISLLRQMIKQDIQTPDVYYYLVAFLGDLGEQKQATEAARAGIEKNPADTQLLYQLGVLYEKQNMRQAAVETMEKILLLDDAHVDALNFLAYDQAESGLDLDLALTRAKKALAIKPSGYIVDTLGWIYFKMGRYPESREQLEKASQLHPDDAVIMEHLGDLYSAMKLKDKAASAYRRVLEIDPQARQVEEKLNMLSIEGF